MSQRAELLEADVVRLEALVRDGLGTMVRCLQIRAEGRGLVLRGYSRTYYAKQLAQHAVMKETQLPILANEIQVS